MEQVDWRFISPVFLLKSNILNKGNKAHSSEETDCNVVDEKSTKGMVDFFLISIANNFHSYKKTHRFELFDKMVN